MDVYQELDWNADYASVAGGGVAEWYRDHRAAVARRDAHLSQVDQALFREDEMIIIVSRWLLGEDVPVVITDLALVDLFEKFLAARLADRSSVSDVNTVLARFWHVRPHTKTACWVKLKVAQLFYRGDHRVAPFNVWRGFQGMTDVVEFLLGPASAGNGTKLL